MSKKTRILSLALLLVLICSLLLLTSCRKSDESETEPTGTQETTTTTTAATTTAAPTATPTPEPTPTPEAPDLNQMNLLTGYNRENPEQEQQRPLAIMINNVYKALPQMGISAADLIIEMPVEYGLTRMMIVFSRVEDIPELGSIRSARHDFVEISASLDAILLHVGGSHFANDLISSQQLGSLDYMRYSQAYWRDSAWQRDRGQEHSVKTEGERILNVLERNEQIRLEMENPRPLAAFHHPDVFKPVDGDPAAYIRVPFSRDTIAEFFYDEATRLYSKHHLGRPHLDLSTNEPLTFTNLLLLQTDIPRITQQGHVDADLNAGDGFYVSGGFAMPIHWEKGDLYDPFQFFTTDGEPLVLNCGKSYLGISPLSFDITISDEIDN